MVNIRFVSYMNDKDTGEFVIRTARHSPKTVIRIAFKDARTGEVRKVRYYKNGKLYNLKRERKVRL